MCFSAEASFAVAGLLVPSGVYCVQAALRKKPRWLPLAAVPLIFAVQQFSEGLVWVGLQHDDPALTRRAALVFLFFALAFWPFWSPFLVWFQETDRVRRWILSVLALVGSVWLGAFYIPLLTNSSALLTAQIRHHSIYYEYEELWILRFIPSGLSELGYLLMVTTPLLVGAGRRGHLPALLLAVSATVAAVVFAQAYVSVWCFFAAVLAIFLTKMFHQLPAA